MKKIIIPSVIGLAAAVCGNAENIDYTDGIFVINEDWYGHQNSTVNFLRPDDPEGDFWKYRVVQAENPGKELGCTNQYGDIWKGKLYLIAKQEKDPGATITGGRITICDAKTLKILHQRTIIDPSGAQCDGRGFVGVTDDKGYVSSSNGVWILDLNTYEILGQVEGTANPEAGGDNDKPNTDPTGSLYHGQSGMMVEAGGRIFVAHQSAGLLVVNPETDCVTDVISMDIVRQDAGIGSVVKAKDGSLWVSVAGDKSGRGTVINRLLRVDPMTLETEIVDLEQDIYGPSNSWYAWTPDAFCSSSTTNTLYWRGGSNSWFSGVWIYKFDVDTHHSEKIIDLKEDGENWKLYGCSMRVDPVTDEIYASLYHEFSIPTYITRRYDSNGTKIKDYEMIMNYWFPSLFVFPENSTKFDTVEKMHTDENYIIVADNHITVSSDTDDTLTVFSITGEMVYKTSVNSGKTTRKLSLSPGIYIAVTSRSVKKLRLCS